MTDKNTQEPVHMVRSHGSDCWEEISGESLETCRCQPEEYEVRTLYAEQPAPVACTSCDGSGEYIDAIGDWRGYCSCPAGVALKNKPAPVAVALPDQVALLRKLWHVVPNGYKSEISEYLDKVKELNQ